MLVCSLFDKELARVFGMVRAIDDQHMVDINRIKTTTNRFATRTVDQETCHKNATLNMILSRGKDMRHPTGQINPIGFSLCDTDGEIGRCVDCRFVVITNKDDRIR